MDLRKMTTDRLDTALEICRRTAAECYGRYYPRAAVDYFLAHHSKERIEKTMAEGAVYLLYNEDDEAVGTVSVTGNEIHRLYVLPEYQGAGCGTYMMDICEEELFETYDEIKLDASLVSYNMYRRRGYVHGELVPLPLSDGSLLCYFPMTKKRQ